MEFEDANVTSMDGDNYAMAVLFREHRTVLALPSIASLILGIPLATNMLWHLKERKTYNTNTRLFQKNPFSGMRVHCLGK